MPKNCLYYSLYIVGKQVLTTCYAIFLSVISIVIPSYNQRLHYTINNTVSNTDRMIDRLRDM